MDSFPTTNSHMPISHKTPPNPPEPTHTLIPFHHPPDGTTKQYKAQLVAKAYNQVEGIDYQETFASVAKITIVCVLLNVAVIQG